MDSPKFEYTGKNIISEARSKEIVLKLAPLLRGEERFVVLIVLDKQIDLVTQVTPEELPKIFLNARDQVCNILANKN